MTLYNDTLENMDTYVTVQILYYFSEWITQDSGAALQNQTATDMDL